jgi:hypothetical protein
MDGMDTHLVEVRIAPHLPVCKHPGQDPALLVSVGPLAHGPTLKPGQAPIEEVGHVDGGQPAAGEPQEGAAHLVVVDGQEVSPMDLGKHNGTGLKEPGYCTEDRLL